MKTIYECERCEAALPGSAWACPTCGDLFDEPVPEDAERPDEPTKPARILVPVQEKPRKALGVLDPPGPKPQDAFVVRSALSVPRVRPARRGGFRWAMAPLVLALGVLGWATSRAPSSRPVSQQLSPRQMLHTVTYRVTGSAAVADVTYQDALGATEQVEGTTVPWSQTFKTGAGSFLYLSAQNHGENGSVSAEIDVDGKSCRRATSVAAYTLADVRNNL